MFEFAITCTAKLTEIANKVMEGIKMECDLPSNHSNNKLPILNMAVWLNENGNVMYQHYSKRQIKVNDAFLWGCFSAKGPGNLYFMPEDVHMNHEVYKTVLQDYMIPAYKRLKCTRFLQDRAPCHRSQHTTAFLKSLGIRVMNWPGNSPDLNSIENVWSKMKYDLREMDCSTKKKLIENIKKVWNNLPREYWVTLADSMPRRIQAVIDNQGGPTKY